MILIILPPFFRKLRYLEKSSSNLYNTKEKKLKITENRKVFTNKELDYTCIELLESDGIFDFFEIEPDLFKYGDKFLVNNDILYFILDVDSIVIQLFKNF